jgi:alkylated DNA repair dioxygenase AlkB
MIPPSASYLPAYIGATAATELLASIDALPWRDDLKRRVQHYGYRYDYKARRVTADSYLGPLPGWLAATATRLASEGIFDEVPDQVIVNEYLPGQGIAAHVDCEPCFGDIIASLSLGSACTMEFTPLNGRGATSQRLEPRSLLILKGESRFEWKHGIPARKADDVGGTWVQRERRVSLTFRNVVQAQSRLANLP